MADNDFLTGVYSRLDETSTSLQRFMDSVYAVMHSGLSLTGGESVADFGCGRGYFLRHLRGKGHSRLVGLEPSQALRGMRLDEAVREGSFEQNDLGDASFDIAFTCHTLHHLENPFPLYALREMARVAARHIVVVEACNTNLAMALRSLYRIKSEANCYRYNLGRVIDMAGRLGLDMVHAGHLPRAFLSSGSIAHRMAAWLGTAPYCMVLATKERGQESVVPPQET